MIKKEFYKTDISFIKGLMSKNKQNRSSLEAYFLFLTLVCSYQNNGNVPLLMSIKHLKELTHNIG